LDKYSPEKLRVIPLTRTNLDGDLYQRLEAVETQINEALKLNSVALIERAKISDEKTPEFVQEECLVALIRAALLSKADRLAHSLIEVLFSRCVGFIYNHLKFENKDRRERAYEEVVGKILDKILDLKTNKDDFLQVRFWIVIKRLAVNTFNKFLRDPIENTLDNSPEFDVFERGYYRTNDEPLKYLLAKETVEDVKRILSELSQRHLDVFILRYLDEWPIESNDTNKITLSNYFGVTPKTIRNWLAEGKATLKKNIGEKGK
jgi:hypothetical protein